MTNQWQNLCCPPGYVSTHDLDRKAMCQCRAHIYAYCRTLAFCAMVILLRQFKGRNRVHP